MRAGLRPMLMGFLLVGVVVGGPGVPGQHVDKADFVRRIGLRTDRLEPRYTSLIAAERRAVPGNDAGKAVSAGLKRPFLAILRHHDGCFGNDLLWRGGLYLGNVRRLRGWEAHPRRGTEGSNPSLSSGESTSRAILPSHGETPAFRAGVRARQVQRGCSRRLMAGGTTHLVIGRRGF